MVSKWPPVTAKWQSAGSDVVDVFLVQCMRLQDESLDKSVLWSDWFIWPKIMESIASWILKVGVAWGECLRRRRHGGKFFHAKGLAGREAETPFHVIHLEAEDPKWSDKTRDSWWFNHGKVEYFHETRNTRRHTESWTCHGSRPPLQHGTHHQTLKESACAPTPAPLWRKIISGKRPDDFLQILQCSSSVPSHFLVSGVAVVWTSWTTSVG